MIVYLHGFNSAPASHKARTFHAYMRERGLGELFVCPRLPHPPQQAVQAIEAELEKYPKRALTLVGSSLGGFYATWFAERRNLRAVLIQPAITPYVGLQAMLGPQQNLYTGERYELTRAHLDGWRRLAVEEVDPERYLLLLETGDELLDWREAVRKYEGARMVIRQGGDHTLQSFPEHIPRILRFAGIAGQ
ncbi:MAG TPA: YqiA/YcfP family alpha/beta fold hydrolase [Burkholderiales bacterium]|nr:YqiA/YcfP family alpha/beta fold hydrolase [Burkholderiales bacterium]